MKIGLDIDDTLTNTQKIFKKYKNKYQRKHHLNYGDKKMSEEEFHDFLNTYGTKIYLNMSLKKDVLKYIHKWLNEGHEIYFITARSNDEFSKMEVCTKVFLKNHKLPIQNIIFASKNKYQDSKQLELDVFVDDHESVLDKFPKDQMLLLRMIPNLNNYSKYTKVANWKQIDFYIHNQH